MDKEKIKNGLKTLEDFKRLLKEFFNNKDVKVYLFGSRARGDNTPYSDIDIGFLTKTDIAKELTLLKELLEKSNLPYKVDLVNLSSSEKLKEIVLKEGERWL